MAVTVHTATDLTTTWVSLLTFVCIWPKVTLPWPGVQNVLAVSSNCPYLRTGLLLFPTVLPGQDAMLPKGKQFLVSEDIGSPNAPVGTIIVPETTLVHLMCAATDVCCTLLPVFCWRVGHSGQENGIFILVAVFTRSTPDSCACLMLVRCVAGDVLSSEVILADADINIHATGIIVRGSLMVRRTAIASGYQA